MAPSLPGFIGTILLLFYYSFMPLHREANLLLDSGEKSFFFDHCISLWQFSIMIFTKKAEICFQINWDFYLMGQMVQSFSEETVGGGSEFIETTRQTFISSHFHLNTKQISPALLTKLDEADCWLLSILVFKYFLIFHNIYLQLFSYQLQPDFSVKSKALHNIFLISFVLSFIKQTIFLNVSYY